MMRDVVQSLNKQLTNKCLEIYQFHEEKKPLPSQLNKCNLFFYCETSELNFEEN